MTRYFYIALFFAAAAIQAWGQSNTIVSGGYEVPTSTPIAPGQVITLYVAGINNSVQAARAASNPLPTSLAGLSVVLRHGTDILLPIFEVRPFSLCPTAGIAATCSSLTAVTVQIPFDIVSVCAYCATPLLAGYQIVVIQDGQPAGSPLEVLPLQDKVHFLTACDQLVSGGGARGSDGLPCTPIVTHADGTSVSASQPARAGEVLVAYAYGLGQTAPGATAGSLPASALPTVTQFNLDFNFHTNALPAKPTPIVAPPFAAPVYQPMPIFSGLTQWAIGLYQVNFMLPNIPAGSTRPCVDPSQATDSASVVRSNLTVSMGSPVSFDGVGICVAP